jgi:hypothetical protein
MKGATMKDYAKELDELKAILFTTQNGLTAVSYQLDALKSEIASSKPSGERDYYPRYFKARNTTLVVRFDSLNVGTVVVGSEHYNEGEFDDCWVGHSDPSTWVEIPYNEELGVAHGQLCECWDNDITYSSALRFYDAVNKCTFTYCGVMDNGSYKFEHYHPLTFAEYPERLKQAALTLDLGV